MTGRPRPDYDGEDYRADALRRLMAGVEFDPNGGCWLWTGSARQDNGTGDLRGQMAFRGGPKSAPRASYWLHHGDPTGFVIRHKCDRPICVNPDHLEIGTQADNLHDMVRRGRHARAGYKGPKPKGSDNPLSSLSRGQIQLIRESPLSSRQLAPVFGVSHKTILKARNSTGHPLEPGFHENHE